MPEHTHIHFIHGLASFLMVLWFFVLITLVMAKYPDNSFVKLLRECVPHGSAADQSSTPTVSLAA